PRPRPARSPSTPPTASASAIEAPAMPSETRTPKTMRDRRSRPNRSVPKGWRGLGPWNTWAASIAVGENGATNAAKSPMAIMRRSAPHAPTKRGLRASERRGAATIARLAEAEPRIEDRIEKRHGEGQDHEGGGEEQKHAQDHRVVAPEDRVEQQPPVAVPSVSAGRAIVRRLVAGRCVNGTHWSDGIQPRWIEKSRISTVPCQKAGSESPSVAITRIAPSRTPPRHTAEAVPSGTPIRSDQPTASAASSAETGTRSRNIARTGRPESQETPKSPRRTDASHSMYWRWTGRSSPKKRRNAASTSGEAIAARSEEHTSELHSRFDLVCR